MGRRLHADFHEPVLKLPDLFATAAPQIGLEGIHLIFYCELIQIKLRLIAFRLEFALARFIVGLVVQLVQLISALLEIWIVLWTLRFFRRGARSFRQPVPFCFQFALDSNDGELKTEWDRLAKAPR